MAKHLWGVSKAATQNYRASITSYPGGDHPHSYQARVVTRDSMNYYYAVRNGSTLEIWRKPHAVATWTLAGSFTCIGTNQGDVASIAVDGNETLHAVYYVTGIDIGYRSSTDRGATWSSQTTIASGVTWGDATCGSPSLAIDAINNLLVVYSDEASTKPYFVRYSGSWSSPVRIADISNSELRPNVISTTSGRIFASFGGAADIGKVYYSDDNGATWTDASPPTSGYSSLSTLKLVGNGNAVYVTAQDPGGSRQIVYNYCTAGGLSWQSSWEVIQSGTGADPNLFVDSSGFLHCVFRQYNTGTFVVYHSSKASGSWIRETISPDVSHILPKTYWQEFHRFSPSPNSPMVILPESAGSIYSQYITGISLA